MVQVSLWVQTVCLGGFQNGKDDHTGVCPGLGVAEELILPSDHDGANGVFHLVVADFNLAMVEELPLVQGVGDCFLQLACWFEDGVQPGVVCIHNGFGKKLALFPPLSVGQIFQLLFHFKKPAAIVQPFRSQDVLLGGSFRHGLNPFSSGVGPTTGLDGLTQDVVAAVAV